MQKRFFKTLLRKDREQKKEELVMQLFHMEKHIKNMKQQTDERFAIKSVGKTNRDKAQEKVEEAKRQKIASQKAEACHNLEMELLGLCNRVLCEESVKVMNEIDRPIFNPELIEHVQLDSFQSDEESSMIDGSDSSARSSRRASSKARKSGLTCTAVGSTTKEQLRDEIQRQKRSKSPFMNMTSNQHHFLIQRIVQIQRAKYEAKKRAKELAALSSKPTK